MFPSVLSALVRLASRGTKSSQQHRQLRGLLTDWFLGSEIKPNTNRQPQQRKAYGCSWSDEYSWLETNTTALLQHLDAEQRYAERCLRHLQPSAALLRRDLLDRAQNQQAAIPETWGTFSYYAEHADTAALPTYMRTDSHGHRQVVLDANSIQSNSNLVSIGQIKISPDQQMVAYTVDVGDGSEAYEGRVHFIGQPQEMDHLSNVVSIEWAGNSNVVYTQPDIQGRPSMVMLHCLGQQQTEDQRILQEGLTGCFLELAATTDGAYITINSNAKTASEVHLLSTSSPTTPPQLVQQRMAGLEYFVSHHQGQLMILTNAHGAVNYQLMTTPLETPSLPHWKTLVPEREGVALQDMQVFATHAVLYENHNIGPAVSVLTLPPHHKAVPSLWQKQAGTTLHADSQAGARHGQNGFATEQARPNEAHTITLEPPQQQPQQNHHPQVVEQAASQQQQQQQQQSGHGSMQQSGDICKKQHLVQQHMQDNDDAEDQPPASVSAQLQHVDIPPWVMSVESGANLDHHSNTVRLVMASPVHPQATYDYQLDTGQLQMLGSESIASHDPEGYVCQVQHAASHDGVQVPMTIVHKKGLPLDGSHPALVSVYGAYGECLDTGFEPERLSLLDRGWVVALAHVRGGGELGRRWHAAGRSANKMNSVLDLEACLDHLLHKGYTGRGLIALQGTSAGGLLVAALLNSVLSVGFSILHNCRRPQHLLAAILRVPFVDFLTCMTRPELPLTVHEYGEWGDPSDPQVLQQMQRLCPYQNIRAADHPPVLATCAVPDSRVPVWGPAKWVAKLREHQKAKHSIMLLHTLDTGHFAHETDLLGNTVLEYSFLLDALNKSSAHS